MTHLLLQSNRVLRSRWLAPTLHILLFALTWLTALIQATPLLDGPARWGFGLLFFADFPISLAAFSAMWDGSWVFGLSLRTRQQPVCVFNRVADSYNECVSKLNVLERIRNAAKGGDMFAQNELGVSLDDGCDGNQDFPRASQWYTKAASQGHHAAQSNLLLKHVLGQTSHYDPTEVIAELKRLATSGDASAQNNLGLCYQFGYGTKIDWPKAVSWFRRAAQSGLATAQFNLGGLYFEGKGLRKSTRLALRWYTRAAEQRDELALIQLGNMYEKGLGTEVDPKRAVVLYLIAYRLGAVRAANHLASLFRKGLGVKRDPSLAYSLYQQAVRLPDSPDIAENPSYYRAAYFWLGNMAEKGDGVERNLEIATEWYRLGAAWGNASCTKALDRLRTDRVGKPPVSDNR